MQCSELYDTEPMDVETAVQIFWREVGRSSLRRVAKLVPVPHSTASAWVDGKLPEGKNREALIAWAKQQASDPSPEVVTAAIQRTTENLSKLAEIRGQARAVLGMLQAVTTEQQKVVDSLEPWSLAESQLIAAGYTQDQAQSMTAADDELVTPAEPSGARKVPAIRPKRAGTG